MKLLDGGILDKGGGGGENREGEGREGSETDLKKKNKKIKSALKVHYIVLEKTLWAEEKDLYSLMLFSWLNKPNKQTDGKGHHNFIPLPFVLYVADPATFTT